MRKTVLGLSAIGLLGLAGVAAITKTQKKKSIEDMYIEMDRLYASTPSYEDLDDSIRNYILSMTKVNGLNDAEVDLLTARKRELVNNKRFLGYYEKFKIENLNNPHWVIQLFTDIECARKKYVGKPDEFFMALGTVTGECKRYNCEHFITDWEARLIRDFASAAYNDYNECLM